MYFYSLIVVAQSQQAETQLTGSIVAFNATLEAGTTVTKKIFSFSGAEQSSAYFQHLYAQKNVHLYTLTSNEPLSTSAVQAFTSLIQSTEGITVIADTIHNDAFKYQPQHIWFGLVFVANAFSQSELLTPLMITHSRKGSPGDIRYHSDMEILVSFSSPDPIPDTTIQALSEFWASHPEFTVLAEQQI